VGLDVTISTSIADMSRLLLAALLGLACATHVAHAALVGVPACPAPSQPLFIMHRPATIGAVVRALDVDGMPDCSEHCARSQVT
jgi:hypothetical protein